jgi:xanthine dehydrogenase accessory factor
VLTYGVTREEANRFGLPCGGTLELVVEPAPDHALLADLAARLEGQLVRGEVDLADGRVRILDACRGEALHWDGQRLATVHGPHWRLLIIGAGQIGRYLASMAQALDYAVSVCDPREEYSAEWDVPGAPLVPACPTTW